VVIDAPGYAACLLAWERPRRADATVADRDRRFESLWTIDPRVVRRAAQASCAIAARRCPALADRIEALLADRPLAAEAPAPGLTALANRVVAYMDG
jgi:DICT domain-containing protein